MICSFCKQDLVQETIPSDEVNYSDWSEYECKNCGYVMMEADSMGELCRWTRQDGDWNFNLTVFNDLNKTTLLGFNAKLYLEGMKVGIYSKSGHFNFTIDHCINVNPDNCLDKMKMLLVFQ